MPPESTTKPTEKTPEQIAAEKAAEEKANAPIQSDAVSAFVKDYLAEAEPKKPEEKKEKDKPKAKADETDKDKDKGKKPADKAPEKSKRSTPVAKPPPVDYDRLAAAAGEGAARAIVASKEKEPEKKAESDPDLDPAEQRRIKVLRHMESTDPKYKGLADRYLASLKSFSAYADKWEADHPGETFKQDDPEHEEFNKKLEASTNYDEDDYIEALTDLKVEEKSKGAQPKLDPEIEELKREKRIRERHRDLVAARDAAGNRYWDELGEDFQGIVKEDGSVDVEALKAMQESEPEKHDEVVHMARILEDLTQQCFLLSQELVEFNPEKVPAHKLLSDFAIEREQDMMAQPHSERYDAQGREFLPKRDYDKLPKAKRDQHWTYSADDLNMMLAARMAKHAKERIKAEQERFERIAKARGIELPQNGERSKAKAKEKVAEEEEETPNTPGVLSEPRLASRLNKGREQPKTVVDTWVSDALK